MMQEKNASCKTLRSFKTLRSPAEWEPQAATFLSFPHNNESWGKRLKKMQAFSLKLLKTIARFQPAFLLISSNEELSPAQKESLQKSKFPTTILEIPTDDIWIRDYGPFFVKRSSRNNEETLLVETLFNAWGKKFPPWKNDNLVPAQIAKVFSLKRKKIPFIFEGGAIEFNGDGLALTTQTCLVGKNRNDKKELSKIIQSLKDSLGLKEILVLPTGLFGDHTDGHIDNVARFVQNNRIVMAEETTPHSPNFNRLKKIRAALLRFLKKHYGNEAQVDTLPLPPQKTLGKEILPASYLNFIFVNGALIFPTYHSEKDKIAFEYFKTVFPERKIIGIDSTLVIEEGGSLHCMTKHQSR